MEHVNKFNNDTLEKLINSDSNSLEEINRSLILKEIKYEPLFNLV
jgi:hypothetical protein